MDYFKEYNDNYGHQEGDRCLIAIAGCISEVAGAHGGFCARYGGDEFVVIYENISKEGGRTRGIVRIPSSTALAPGFSFMIFLAQNTPRKKANIVAATPVFKDAAYCHNHTGHVLRCTKGRKQSVGFFTCGR